MRRFILILLLCWPLSAVADDKLVRLHAPDQLIATGLMRHILPRFSLKTQVRVELVTTVGAAQVVLGQGGQALFQDATTVWYMTNAAPDHPGAARFASWLTGGIGTRTILSFAPDGTPLFTGVEPVARVVEVVSVDGDAEQGRIVSVSKCGRCHAADEAGRMNDIGSTPSFFLLRSLPDWQDRFSAFYALNPHPAFTQVKDVTPPFAIDLPPAIVPLEMTLDELEAILAYVANLKAAELGAPLKHQ